MVLRSNFRLIVRPNAAFGKSVPQWNVENPAQYVGAAGAPEKHRKFWIVAKGVWQRSSAQFGTQISKPRSGLWCSGRQRRVSPGASP